ncbi:MAG: DUF5688 family protein [Clostridia bacterium]|nr:DUF5688 family protein [Clostridia bacterium]
MMEYNTFKEIVSERICDYLPPVFNNYYPVVESVAKINEKKDALTLRSDDMDERMAMPVIYLDEMYDVFKTSEDLDDVLECAAEIIVNFAGMFQDIDNLLDIKTQKENIIPNIINSEMNGELLKDTPHMDVLDMSVIYRIMMKSPRGGYDSCVVTHSVLEELGIDQRELHELAMNNMKKVLPLEINRISRTDDKQARLDVPDSFTFVSSKQRLYGASYMLLEDLMKELCDELKSSRIFVIPFNINEICVTASDDVFLDNLLDILYQSNIETDSTREYLSNAIYCFDSDRGALSKAAAYHSKKGLN